MKTFKILITLVCVLFFVACAKPGPGGKASISVDVKANNLTAAGAMVLLKYDAQESPGSNAEDYDENKISNAQGEVFFTNLNKGDYYVFAKGLDVLGTTISAGESVEIDKRIEVIEVLLLMK